MLASAGAFAGYKPGKIAGAVAQNGHELGFADHIIDRQMGHKDDNRTRAAYNFAEYKEERAKMMQAWADYVDSLRRDHMR